jgi:hypothetical protein
MCETSSWHTCVYAFGFAFKSGCDNLPLSSRFHLILTDRSRCRGWTILHRSCCSGSRGYKCGWSFTIIGHDLVVFRVHDLEGQDS